MEMFINADLTIPRKPNHFTVIAQHGGPSFWKDKDRSDYQLHLYLDLGLRI
jgi:hypothetical protein